MKKLVILAILTGLASGCAVVPSTMLDGLLLTTTEVPGLYYGDDNPTGGSKIGEACLNNFLSLIVTGDASISRAMANGNIKNVYTIDHEVQSFLLLYGRYCTIVRGD